MKIRYHILDIWWVVSLAGSTIATTVYLGTHNDAAMGVAAASTLSLLLLAMLLDSKFARGIRNNPPRPVDDDKYNELLTNLKNMEEK